MTLAVLCAVPSLPTIPSRRVVYQIGDISCIWQRVAAQCEPGVWLWDVSDMDRIRIERHKNSGRMLTAWERRDDGEIWLLVRWAK